MRQQLISTLNEPELHFLVHHYAEELSTPAPRAMLLDDDDVILYSTGSPACLVISEGCLHLLSDDEFERRIRREIRYLSANMASPSIQ